MKINLLITTLFSLLNSIAILDAINRNLICGLSQIAVGFIIAVMIGMIVFCLITLYEESSWIFGFIVIGAIISGAVYVFDLTKPEQAKTARWHHEIN